MKNILIDTNFIIAYLLELDESHERAINLEDKEGILNNNLYITNHIIDEIITIIGQKASPKDAINTYRLIKDNFIIINEYEIIDFNDRVIRIYNKLNKNKQKIGFTDCAIIETAKFYNLDAIVTFDKGFKNNGIVEIIN